MSEAPEISVVMSVYNGATRLRETIDSVLTQQGVSLEFIIVDDGSTDESSGILREYALADDRINLIRQENRGLTLALITGCAAAKGKYIARQDAGDISQPGRLAKQSRLLDSDSDVVLVSCGTRFLGPENEILYEEVPTTSDLTEQLLTFELDKIKGPTIHGCTMFSRQAYERVGGYRSAFYFAQDLDLWVRMAESGQHVAVLEVLYEAAITVGSISSCFRKQQIDTARLILECARRRRDGLGEDQVLEQASQIKPESHRKSGRLERANALYFIGTCLRRGRSPKASSYFQRALLTYPFHVKSALRLLAR